MTLGSCAHYCQDYAKCAYVLLTLQAHESKHGEKHPAEKALRALGDPPPCLRPYPPERTAMGPGGTNS